MSNANGLSVNGWLLFVLAVLLSLFQLWQPIVGFFPPGGVPFEHVIGLLPATYFRPTHLTWILIIGFLAYPISAQKWLRGMDFAIILAVAWSCSRVLVFDYRGLGHILYGLTWADFAAGGVLILATLELARRCVGMVMMWVGVVFLAYAAFGNYLPDVVATRGFSFERIVRFQVFTNAGLFGAPLGIAAGAVFSFVLFGAFLQVTGAGKFLIDMSFAVAGKYRGGPAKASVLASAAMGSISGSAIANTVTTGSLTIPMMKQLGYRPDQAAGIEAAASTGGQIMPPIMGAGAFVMAEFTKTSYGEIVWMSLVPAILYFVSVLMYVHIMAVKAGFVGMQSTQRIWFVVRNGVHFLLPLLLITGLLLENYSPVLVGVSGCLAVVLASLLRKHTRVGVKQIGQALRSGALMAVPISVACAIAGLVVGTIGQTGIGLQFTESVVGLSGGQLWLALALVALAALVLGMGLPATAAYIVLAVMTAPALQELGLALIVAHMIIFWLAQTSNVTPPIALAAFAGAGVAGAPPMRAAFEAFKLAGGLFIIPLMMAFSPLLLQGDISWSQVLVAAMVTLALMMSLAAVVERYFFAPLTTGQQLASGVCVILLVIPSSWSRILGLVLWVAVAIVNYYQSRANKTKQNI